MLKLVRTALAALTVALSVSSVHAALPAGLSIQGKVMVDTANSGSAILGASQSGSISITENGNYFEAGFLGETTNLIPSSIDLPLLALGDGIGGHLSMSGASQGASNNTGMFIDYLLSLANSSAHVTYTVTFKADMVNSVAATGSDSYAFSKLSVKDPLLNELYFNENNIDTFNPSLTTNTASPSNFFSVTLTPGQATQLAGLQHVRGGTFLSSTPAMFSADASVTFSIHSIQAVPEMTSLVLALSGLAVVVWLRRRH